ncbi:MULTISPECIES: GGDEF domain-containing protein [unclassified Xanthobacter]|uniref:GGDEF domain-containing protein n=1 Tax=unclassified Xanthobacter TaxID=2623496 RepID=UPI001EE152EE|nr:MULTISPECIES: GGDEF domain-containing protein [unclassified Xanthobacter]
MQPAGFTLVMNMAVAGLFAASYVAIALLNRGSRAPIWFAVSYAIGMLTPMAQLGLAYSGWTVFFGGLVFFSFAAALLAMVPALAVFYRTRPPWRLVGALALGTVILGPALPLLGRGRLVYELAYQAPFAAAMAACVWVVLRASPRQISDLMLALAFALLAAHFPAKAVVAWRLGTGSLPTDYIGTTYALVSQVSSGILLVATGLVLLIKALQQVIRESEAVAETDPLTAVANRRGFTLRAERLLTEAREHGRPAAVLMLDLDHFKAVNDTFGHAAGDAALRAFGALLRRSVPQSALVARLGGEEFVVLLDRTPMDAALLHAEALRLATLDCAEPGLPALSVSIGVAALPVPYDLSRALERADRALYAAKRAGRNCVRSEEMRPSLKVKS